MINETTFLPDTGIHATLEPDPQQQHQQRHETRRVWTSQSLLMGQKAVEIAHNGCLYRLQATKLGKLILTK